MKRNHTALIAVIGSILVMLILVLGTMLMGRIARRDTENAVRSVSLLYLDELAGRREQVVENNLQRRIQDIQVAVSLMNGEDLSSLSSLQAYQARMKQLYGLEKFAFVDTAGRIYTSLGMQDNIGDYAFDYLNLSGPEISILNLHTPEKKVVIAVPVDRLKFGEETFTVCFMEIDMQEMLRGVSMQAQEGGATYCNIYTTDGIALSNTVLGGLAVEDNLLEAVSRADFESGYSYEAFLDNFTNCRRGEVSFSYQGIQETLTYVPVGGTDWLLTYLIRESVISEQIGGISASIIRRSILQSLLTVAVLLTMFCFIILQTRKTARLALEKETADAENRVKQQELEERLSLQKKLLEEERHRTQSDHMITALASDYRIVYHVDLDRNEAVCYRADPQDQEQTPEGVHFPYLERFTRYAEQAVAENYREGFLRFIQPDAIREGLRTEPILAYRYLARRAGREYYEMIRVAGVRHAEDRTDGEVHAIGLGLTVIDAEMRQSMAQQAALSDALTAAEEASRAKTAFLSSMSHEIRTPMNVIIGLDTIALNDPETSEKARTYLTRIDDNAKHLLSLINDILDMSRIESGRVTLKKEEFSFSRLLESVSAMFSGQCADAGLEYSSRTDGPVDDYYVGDGMKLRQILTNILSNAVKFTPRGGSVSLAVERTAHFEGHTTLRFTVADTGIGISPEFLPHIFDAFSQEDSSTTSKYGSSGLGMAITRSLVEMMNGTIRVESEKGRGTTFTVTVTLADSARRKDAAPEEEINPREMSVLVIDDDPIACEHARLVLESEGIAAETAGSGAEALEKVKLRHTRRNPYNLILMDWKMPEMDGVETTRRIRSVIGDESAIIILTAYRWDDILDTALAAGVDSFVSKPVVSSAVLEEYRSAAAKKRSSPKRAPAKADLKGRRILLAEDMPVNAEIMVMVLKLRGIEADLAANGRIAVEKFAENPAGTYDAILMDMRMPEMDGLEATRRIRAMEREDAKKIPIIALTANAFDEDVQRSLQAGLNAHLSKPVEPDTLFETLESLIPAE